jgi:hypothetical protein
VNFPTETAVRIREAINDTLSALRPAPALPAFPESARTALQTHLEFLLQQEKALFTAEVQIDLKMDTTRLQAELTRIQGAIAELRVAKYGEPDPWYPDDSGEWVEWPGGDRPVSKHTLVEILCESERALQSFHPQGFEAGIYCWSAGATDRIVAYKVVKP